MKIDFGSIANVDGTRTKDIIVKSVTGNNPIDILIGGSAIVFGVLWLTNTAFKNGAVGHAHAVDKAMYELGIMAEDMSKVKY